MAYRLILAVLMMSASACSETYDTTYVSYAEAERDGAAERGWIPDFVPRNARDIRDVHDLDTNQQTLSFFINPDAVPKFIGGFNKFANEGRRVVSFTIDDGRITVDRDNGHVVFKR